MSIRAAEATAPGKIILFGEHSVVYPGRKAIAASVSDLRVCVQVEPRSDLIIEIKIWDAASGSFTDCCVPTASLYGPPASLLGKQVDAPCSPDKAVEVVVDTVLQNALEKLVHCNSTASPQLQKAQCALLFLSAVITQPPSPVSGKGLVLRVTEGKSRIPLGAGLGSSAALCVAASAALLQATSRLPVSNSSGGSSSHDSGATVMKTTAVQLDASGRDAINRWAYVGETYLHGKPSGIDNTVSTYGGAVCFGKARRGTGAKNTIEHLRCFPPMRVMVTNTHVDRETKRLVAGVADLRRRLPAVVDCIFDSIDTVVSEGIQALQGSGGQAAQEVALADLIPINHCLLRAIGVSHPCLEEVVRIMETAGLATKLTGAGGGGCTVTLLQSSIKPGTKVTLESATKVLNERGFTCSMTNIGGEGVCVNALFA